ncbi:solute carrier family 35 member F5 [Condylostylus longicornis]|uniref:solute carrier family 35 member F5 n=1 Tax=Condylostylus longicornis TaxID=2530218 RepID=UPI00244DA211|nr:solute carrier family 35 member F5 [Condylostylus longicornis]
MLSIKVQKLLLGICLLILVDIIWVSSSELTKYIYDEEKYDKPFFCTYFKTSMFTLYLLIIVLMAPWKETCERNKNYSIMENSAEEDNYFSNQNSLSDPSFVPIRAGSETISGTESDDSSIRSVRFSKMAEVREMSAHEATDALMSRLSYAASLRIRRQKSHHKTARTALLFCVMWFVANYLFQLSLELIDTAVVTLISSTSSLFTLILAAFYPSIAGDKFTYSKFLIVIMNITGVIMVTISQISDSSKYSRGIVLALISAFFYAAYLVFVKRKSDTEEKIDIPLFFGFVGLFNLLLMWPIFFILNLLQIETFELPNQRQFAVLFLNGFIGTVLSEALWLWGCFLTSSLIGTLSMTLQIPLSMVFDLLIHHKVYSIFLYCGSIPIFLSLVIVTILMKNDDVDPVLKILKICHRKLCVCRQANIVRVNDEEQEESLIGNHEN